MIMRLYAVSGVLAICMNLAMLGGSYAFAQGWTPLAPEKRCPSAWGASDERGAANHMGPEAVLKAVRLVKDGAQLRALRAKSAPRQ